MKISYKSLFLLLVIIQAFHSIEEYIGKLWENFPPATYLCSLISDDLRLGFIIINIGFFIVGLLTWNFIVRHDHPATAVVIWIWVCIELMNGIVHPAWSVMQQSYTPGVITAPFLFITAVLLLRQFITHPEE